MNLTSTEADQWFSSFIPLARDMAWVDLFVLPPFTSLCLARERLAGTAVAWGAQDVSTFEDGQHTGDVSAAMLADLGCRYVEVGHADRRREHGETPAIVAAKTRAALRAGMGVILCTGEPVQASVEVAIREVIGDLEDCLTGVSVSELGRIVVAYEPIWAIGEGRRPAAPGRVGQVHRAIAERFGDALGAVPPKIVYGGSVDAQSAARMLAESGVDGLFVGRNGLDPQHFAAIAAASSTLALVDRQ